MRHNLYCTLFALTVGFGLSACSWFKSDTVKGAVDVLKGADVVCHALEAGFDLPEDIRIACKYIDQVDGKSKTFFASVPRAQAMKMGMRAPCVQPASSASSK